jgi:hypothetical protein
MITYPNAREFWGISMVEQYGREKKTAADLTLSSEWSGKPEMEIK